MPVIQPRPKVVLKSINIKMDEAIAARLIDYANYLNMSRDEVVSLALSHAMETDKEFTRRIAPAMQGTAPAKTKAQLQASAA